MTIETPYLSAFSIKKLFGKRNYHLNFRRSFDEHANDINVLYGENGGGKTTILKFIYGALTTEAEGFRSWIAKLPFTEACLEFSDGSNFLFKKINSSHSYSIQHNSNNENHVYHIIANADGNVNISENGSDIKDYIRLLSKLNFEIFYLTDKREYFTTSKIISEVYKKKDISTSTHLERFLKSQQITLGDRRERVIDVIEMSDIIFSVFQSQVVESGIFAQQNTNAIYYQLLSTLSSSDRHRYPFSSKEELLRKLQALKGEMHDGEEIGLMPHADLPKFEALISNSDSGNLDQISLLMNLFIEGQNARINAAKPLVTRMKNFVGELNKFYTDKLFKFDMKRKFFVTSKSDGSDIEFEWLSSGERQLFTILSSVFLTQGSPGIVLIDEPEISLNVLWQRELAKSLKRISNDSPMQYILASHSLEILSSQSVNIVSILDQRK